MTWLKRISILLATVAVLVAGLGTASPVAAQDTGDGELLRTNYERIFADVYRTVAPSVVSVNILSRAEGANPLFEDQRGGGTGFVYDTDGRLVTNAHVVDSADEIAVYFLDGTIARAEIIGLDRDSDIAVIQVEDVPSERLIPVEFGDSGRLIVGQAVLAIGSPFGEDWTLTSGIVSAVNRSIRGLSDFSTGDVIQTDTAINPGNSGGPLLNLDGQVVGVNTQILSASRSSSGVGFAVPSNLVQRVIISLIEDGEVEYSYLGIAGADMRLEEIENYSLPNNLQGAVVSAVVDGSPADAAGLRNPTNNSIDVIIGIDGTPITSMDDLLAYLAGNTRPGDTVIMQVNRGGQAVELTLTLENRPTTGQS